MQTRHHRTRLLAVIAAVVISAMCAGCGAEGIAAARGRGHAHAKGRGPVSTLVGGAPRLEPAGAGGRGPARALLVEDEVSTSVLESIAARGLHRRAKAAGAGEEALGEESAAALGPAKAAGAALRGEVAAVKEEEGHENHRGASGESRLRKRRAAPSAEDSPAASPAVSAALSPQTVALRATLPAALAKDPKCGEKTVAQCYWGEDGKGSGLLFPYTYPKFAPRGGFKEDTFSFFKSVKAGKKAPLTKGEQVTFDFDTCAVVGSSKILKKKKRGEEIDNHTAVFRFNEAPANRAYVPFVGQKTTIRIQNSVFCGYSEGPSEYCMPMQGGALPNCHSRKGRKCTVVDTPGAMLNYGGGYFSTIPVPKNLKGKDRSCRITKGKCGRRMSGGFFGMMLAMNLCKSVDVYGFTHKGGGDHYFPKKVPKGITKPWQEKHQWVLETAAFKQMGRIPGVRLYTK